MRPGMRWVLVRSLLFIWWREYRYRGFHWANRRMFGHRVGRWP